MAHDELVKRLLWHVEQTIGPVSDEPIVNEHDSDKAVLLFNFYAETKRAIDYWYRQGKDDQHQTDADRIEKLEADLMDAQADNAIGIARIAELEADNARLTKWKPIETAPDDDWFLAAIEVRHKNGGHWWEYHVVWLDEETGDIHTDCEQGWSISDYSHWMALPNAPYPLSAALQETSHDA